MNVSQAKQQGAALFVALIILLVVTMMGLSAMRGGIFHEKMAFNTQANDQTFQAAETAIGGVVEKARQSDAMLSDMMNSGTTQTGCVTSDKQLVIESCGDTTTFDDEDRLQAQAVSQFDRAINVASNDSSALVDYEFDTIGDGKYKKALNLDFESRNRQYWRKLGPGGGPFGVSDTSKIDVSAP